jgi:hypothetical protein
VLRRDRRVKGDNNYSFQSEKEKKRRNITESKYYHSMLLYQIQHSNISRRLFTEGREVQTKDEEKKLILLKVLLLVLRLPILVICSKQGKQGMLNNIQNDTTM